MMSISARRELLDEVARCYRSASRAEKRQMLDEFARSTGYHRKYALALLLHAPLREGRRAERKRQVRRRGRKYPAAIRAPLVILWEAANCICAKRLVPFLPELIIVLERHQELQLEPHLRPLLLQISPATVDRLLRHERQVRQPRGLPTTKPGTLLKRQIPVQTFSDWDETRPGFLEVDLVAHCGQSTEGEYLYTLVLTDLYTAWTICVPLLSPVLLAHAARSRSAWPSTMCARCCPSPCWGSTRTTVPSSSTLPCCATAESIRSPSPVPVPTARTTRPMWSRRTGPTSASSSATHAMLGRLLIRSSQPCTRRSICT